MWQERFSQMKIKGLIADRQTVVQKAGNEKNGIFSEINRGSVTAVLLEDVSSKQLEKIDFEIFWTLKARAGWVCGLK